MKKNLKVMEHLDLSNCSGQTWRNSLAFKYLQNLPIANSETNAVMDTRYLLPRENIFTFGFENGITNPVTYFSCKLCQLLIKIHELKSHMLSKHPNIEETIMGGTAQTSCPQLGGKSKKNSHKTKKKVVPPPNVPPPPLFPNIEILKSANTVPAMENLLPPVLQSIETVKENNSTYTMEVDAVSNISTRTEQNQISPSRDTSPPTISILRSKRDRLETHKHVRSKKKKNDYNPDKNCGVLDHSNRPCMRAITCSNHSIVERRAVQGRSANIDLLIAHYKSSKFKTKHTNHHISTVHLNIAPKASNNINETKSGYKYLEVIYDKNWNNLGNFPDHRCSLPPNRSSNSTNQGVDKLHKRESSVLQSIKVSDSSNTINVQPTLVLSSENGVQLVTAKLKTSSEKLIKLRLLQSSTTLPLPNLPESAAPLTPTLYSLHPKPMTMLTGSLRRIGSSIALQNFSRLERQRMDLQTVVNQHKQLKLSISNKAVFLLNSNNSKQSILRNNVKNNVKTSSLKRTALDKTTEFKHMKVVAADLNGILFNANFTDSNNILNFEELNLLK